MRSVNKVILLGTVTRDAEHVKVGSYDLVKFSLATNRKWKKQNGEEVEEAEFHNCEKWNSPNMKDFIKKGAKVYVEGRLKTEDYEKDGVKKRIVKIMVDEWSVFTSGAKNTQSRDFDGPDF